MKEITENLSDSLQACNLCEEAYIVVDYCNMLTEKVNELIQENEALKAEISKLRRINNLW